MGQTLEDVTLYIKTPKHIKAKDLRIELKTKHIQIGIKKMKPFISDDLSYPINSMSSTWYMEDDGVCISLTKKSMMLERFSRENPGMDFSSAQFSGSCPEPTQFL